MNLTERTELLKRKNFSDFEILTSADTIRDLPEAWQRIADTGDIAKKQETILQYWEPFSEKLPKMYALLEQYITDAFVISTKTGAELIYVFNTSDFTNVYVGYPPVQSGPFLNEMADDIAAFYKTVHNGWYEAISWAVGFLPLQQIEYLDVHEWGILEDIDPPAFDMGKTFAIFQNGGGGYFCIDNTIPGNPDYLVFWTDRAPQINKPFWPFMDAWMEIGLTN